MEGISWIPLTGGLLMRRGPFSVASGRRMWHRTFGVLSYDRTFMELVFLMTLLRRIAISAVFLVCAASGVRAQTSLGTPINLFSGGSFTVGGDKFTISACTASSNDGVGCASTTGLEVVGTVFRGLVTLEVENKTAGSPILTDSNSSAATLKLTVTVSTAAGKTYQAISALDTTTTGNLTTGHTGSGAFAVTNTSGGTFGTTLTDTLPVTSPTSMSSNESGTEPTTGMSVQETLTLASNNASGNNILTGLLAFQKAPEPASISIMLLGLGGLAVTRLRKRRA